MSIHIRIAFRCANSFTPVSKVLLCADCGTWRLFEVGCMPCFPVGHVWLRGMHASTSYPHSLMNSSNEEAMNRSEVKAGCLFG